MKFISRFFGKLSDLQKRILFTLGALVIYRIGSFIPLPGVNASAVLHLFTGEGSGMMGMFDMFTGGSLSRMSVLALNIFLYVSLVTGGTVIFTGIPWIIHACKKSAWQHQPQHNK